MSMSFESHQNRLTVHGDFNGEAEKRRAMFLASLMTPGGIAPADLEPQNFQDVELSVAPDVAPHVAAQLCKLAAVEIEIR